MIKYKYNSEGLREEKVGEREVRYLLDGLAVLCEYDEEGIKREYVEGVSMKENNQKYYYIYDWLGNVRYVLDENGAVVKSYSYSPFGQIHSSSGSLSQPYQFVGGEFYWTEEDIGLYLLGQRWYDAEVGRFISRDPILAINFYPYDKNNSLNLKIMFGAYAIPIVCQVPEVHPVCLIIAGIIICYCRPNHNFPGCHLVLSETVEYIIIKIGLDGRCVPLKIPVKECTYDCYDLSGRYYKEKIINFLGFCPIYLPF